MGGSDTPDARRARGKLADALAQFWRSGDGPSHHDLDLIFDDVGVEDPSEPGSPKWQRVQQTVRSTPDHLLWLLVSELVESISDDVVDPRTEVVAKDVERLRRTLAAHGRDLDDSGRLAGGAAPALLESSALVNVEVMRRHLQRLRRASADDDPEAVIGTAKEAVESAAKLVLNAVHGTYDETADLPSLAKQAQKALLLHGSAHSDADDRIGKLTKQVLGGLNSIASGVTQFRNTAGTGHGREQPVSGLSRRHAKLAAGAAIVYCEMLLDTLQDAEAPWKRAQGTEGAPPTAV